MTKKARIIKKMATIFKTWKTSTKSISRTTIVQTIFTVTKILRTRATISARKITNVTITGQTKTRMKKLAAIIKVITTMKTKF